jgi:hypothetical protein
MNLLLQVAKTAPSAEYFKGYRDGLRLVPRGDAVQNPVASRKKSPNAGKGKKCSGGYYISPTKNCREESRTKAAELIDPFSPENNPNFPKGVAVEPKAKAKSRAKPKTNPDPAVEDFEVLDLVPVDTPPAKKRSRSAKNPKPTPEERPKSEKKPKKEMRGSSASSGGAGWKPTMSDEEAKEYTKESYFQEPFYHGTSKSASDGIQSQGVETKKIGRGQFGAGFYLTNSESEADMYANGYMSQNPDGSTNTSQAATMTVRVNIRKPKVFSTSKQFAKFKEKLGFNFHDNDPKSAKIMTDALREKGFDGVYIKDRGYAVAFDKEQVVVTNSREAKSL